METTELKSMRESDFTDGVQVTPDEIKEWHKKCVKTLLEKNSGGLSYTRSGNGLVIARRSTDELGDVSIEVYEINNGYRHFVYDLGQETTPPPLTQAVELLKECEILVESLILATPTGKERDIYCDTNIKIKTFLNQK